MAEIRDVLEASLGNIYSFKRELGGGGMSRVFLAEDKRLRREVVVKVLAPDLARGISAERFEREILVTAQLQQANIAPLLSAGEINGIPYYVMPFVEGESLRTLLDQHRAAAPGEAAPSTTPLALGDGIGIIRDIARALAYAHSHGIIHRDIKPENVLVSGGTAVVTDFGIGRAIANSQISVGTGTLTSPGTAIGTPAYMAPEQALGDQTTEQSDVYSWGVIAYELLSGSHPFSSAATPQQFIAAHVIKNPVPLNLRRDDVPSVVADLIMHCLEKDPSARPANGTKLLEELTRAEELPKSGKPRSTTAPRLRIPILAGAVILAFALTVAAFTLLPRLRGSSKPAGASVAVLPFANVSGDAQVEYFADGMTDELTGILATLPGLRVTSRSSSFAFKGKNTSSREVGATLRVGTLVEGSVRREGDRLRVSAQLTNAEDGVVLWSHSYEREVKDAFAIQDEIATSLASQLQLRLGEKQLMEARQGRTANHEAHDQYLHGMFYSRQPSEAALRQAITHFERAVELDSGYAQAYAGLGTAWSMLDATVSPREVFGRIRKASLKALALDDGNAEAHALLAYVLYVFDHDFAAAERELKRALELNPNSVTAHNTYFPFLVMNPERIDEALRHVERSIALDPLSPVQYWMRELGLYLAGRYDDVLVQHQQTRRIDPRFVVIDSWSGAAYREKGMYAEALTEYDRAQKITGMPMYGLAMTYARMGRVEDARRIARDLEALRRTQHVVPEWIAIAWGAAGNTDSAMYWLDRALEEKSNILIHLNSLKREFDPLRHDPRFHELKRKIGLP